MDGKKLVDAKRRKKEQEVQEEAEVDGETAGILNSNTVTAKAIKLDGAAVPVHLWDEKVMEHFPWLAAKCDQEEVTASRLQKALHWLRQRSLPWWKMPVKKDFFEWFNGSEHVTDQRSDIEEWRVNMVDQLKMASWWEWQGGSTPFFWRWPPPYQQDLRRGVPA
mmetsp:Transcript_22806/g.34538  ORF Transcript_22806/g.34538 Transcript_22806/m.34538 type:complete len:164 (+) Transcript_22806:1207-1698(+)